MLIQKYGNDNLKFTHFEEKFENFNLSSTISISVERVNNIGWSAKCFDVFILYDIWKQLMLHDL